MTRQYRKTQLTIICRFCKRKVPREMPNDTACWECDSQQGIQADGIREMLRYAHNHGMFFGLKTPEGEEVPAWLDSQIST